MRPNRPSATISVDMRIPAPGGGGCRRAKIAKGGSHEWEGQVRFKSSADDRSNATRARPCLPRRTLTHAGSWDERAAASIGENASDPTRLTPHRQPLISARSIIPVLMRAPSATRWLLLWQRKCMHDGRVGGTARSPAPPVRYEVRLPQHARTRHAPPLNITCSPAGAMCVCVCCSQVRRSCSRS